jgi:hypothetical protein
MAVRFWPLGVISVDPFFRSPAFCSWLMATARALPGTIPLDLNCEINLSRIGCIFVSPLVPRALHRPDDNLAGIKQMWPTPHLLVDFSIQVAQIAHAAGVLAATAAASGAVAADS